MRDTIRAWRFYDSFRTDGDAPARQSHLGTRTPVLRNDGGDLASALQTVMEIGDEPALNEAIADAFPGATLEIDAPPGARFAIRLKQAGLLRPLSAAELSDGTLRYLLWVAALLTPRPPPLMVLNEPETSLHPELLPALARLILRASERIQTLVVSHSAPLIAALSASGGCESVRLEKELSQTKIVGQGLLTEPPWDWPD